MLYEEARVYLDSVSKYGSVLGLDSIKNLLEELGNPQKELTFIHIAGTNGKGSILAYLMLSSSLYLLLPPKFQLLDKSLQVPLFLYDRP